MKVTGLLFHDTSPRFCGESSVWTTKISHVACSPLTVMKFGIDEKYRYYILCTHLRMKAQSLKIAVYLLGGLFILLIITTTWLLGDNKFV